MTAINNSLPDDVSLMRDLLNEVSGIYLDLHDVEIVRSEERSMFESDHEALEIKVGKSSLADEIQHVTSIYLFETAHELKALATLLDANQIAGSIELFSRAAIERCGRVSWLLDHDPQITPRVRSARIFLELAVSWQHYREIIQSQYSDAHEANKDATARFREMRTQIEQNFKDIKKGVVGDEIGGFTPSPEIQSWTLDGVSYPEYTELATWAWFGGNSKKAKATYRMLCAFSHPSIAASREHQINSGGNLTFRYDISYINKVVSNTVAAYDRAFQSFCSYFDRNFESVQVFLSSVHDRWPTIEDDGSEPDR